MAGRLSFSIAVNLMTESFKKGANQVRDSFRAIRTETVAFAAALGAGGLGLTELLSRFIDVARETGRVTTALRNASTTTGQYADNLNYVTRLAKQYGLEVNALTGNYARFIATAHISGMSLQDQRKIFESLSRASTAFGLSADQTNSVFTALSQMMSKGKISSEELRQQMGEQLPVALQAMAKAAGTTMAGLEELLQRGQLMSADVLPKFAEALNELVPNVSTDNLEASVNRLKNTFTDLVNSSGVQDFYKRLVDLFNSLLGQVQNGITGIVAFVATMIGLKMVGNIASYFQRIEGIIQGTVETHRRAEEQKLAATDKRIQAEQALARAQSVAANASANEQVAAANQVERAKTALARAQAAERRAILAEQTAAEQAAAVQSQTLWGKAATRIKLAWAGVATAIKGALVSTGIGALMVGISSLAGYLANAYREAKRIRDIFSDYQGRMTGAGDVAEASQLQTLLNLMNDRSRSQEEINAAQSKLQEMLGTERLSQDEINKRVQNRIKLLKEAARAQQAATEIADTESRNRELARSAGLSEDELADLAGLRTAARGGDRFASHEFGLTINDYSRRNGNRLGLAVEAGVSKINKAIDEYLQNQRVLNDATEVLSKAQTAAAKLQQGTNNAATTKTDTDTGKDKGESELQKQQQRYAQSLRELNARREVEGQSAEEYAKALDELNRSSLIAAKATGDREVLESEYVRNLQQAVDNPVHNEAAARLAEVQAEYAETQRVAKARLDARLITEEQYRDALSDAALSAALAAASIQGIGTAADEFIAQMRQVFAENSAPITRPTLGSRDTTFDYKKSGTDIAREELDIWINYRDDLQEKLEQARRSGSDMAAQLESDLNTAIAGVDSLEDALKIAEVQEDVENLRKEMSKGLYSGIKNIASGADRLVSAFSNVTEVMEDADSSAWERILAVWNAMTQTVDTMLSIADTIRTITELTESLAAAQQAEAAVNTAATSTKVANAATEAATVQATTASNLAAAHSEVAANTAKGTSAAAASAAKLPFPANLIAIGAAIAAVLALFASIPKFATGGIVTGGSSSGDKLLARVNAGEMILNQSQQARLFRMLNEGFTGGATGGGTRSVTIGFDKVRGSDIYLSLKNYMKSTGKKI